MSRGFAQRSRWERKCVPVFRNWATCRYYILFKISSLEHFFNSKYSCYSSIFDCLCLFIKLCRVFYFFGWHLINLSNNTLRFFIISWLRQVRVSQISTNTYRKRRGRSMLGWCKCFDQAEIWVFVFS